MKRKPRFEWRDDIRVLPAMPLHIFLRRETTQVSLERSGDEYVFRCSPGELPNLPIKEELIGQNVWQVRDSFLKVQTPTEAFEFLSAHTSFLAREDELPQILTWSSFTSWQNLVKQISLRGFLFIAFKGLEDEGKARFFRDENNLAPDLQALIDSPGLTTETLNWVQGSASYLDISARPDIHMKLYPDDSMAQCSVITGSIIDAVLAATYFNEVVGIKSRKCEQEDCANIFEGTTAHARRFCSVKCAHTQQTRELRRSKREEAARAKAHPKKKAVKRNGN